MELGYFSMELGYFSMELGYFFRLLRYFFIDSFLFFRFKGTREIKPKPIEFEGFRFK